MLLHLVLVSSRCYTFYLLCDCDCYCYYYRCRSLIVSMFIVVLVVALWHIKWNFLPLLVYMYVYHMLRKSWWAYGWFLFAAACHAHWSGRCPSVLRYRRIYVCVSFLHAVICFNSLLAVRVSCVVQPHKQLGQLLLVNSASSSMCGLCGFLLLLYRISLPILLYAICMRYRWTIQCYGKKIVKFKTYNSSIV